MACNFEEGQGNEGDGLPKDTVHEGLISALVSDLGVDSFIEVILLSTWDNVVGPKLCHVWYSDQERCKIGEKCILHVASLTGRDLFHDGSEGEGIVSYKLLLLPQHDVVVNCYKFYGCLKDGRTTLYAFSILMPTRYLNDYMPLYQICETRIVEFTAKFRLFQFKNYQTAIEKIFNDLKAFLIHITAIVRGKLSGTLEIADTWLFSIFKNTTKEEIALLEKAITSHLQTCRCSIVIGSDMKQINKMVRTLAMFNSEKELQSSRINLEDDERINQSYLPDLYLQGLLMELESLPISDIVRSHRPTTIISLHNWEVYRTALPDQHASILQEILKIDLATLWINNNKVTVSLSPQMLTLVEEGALLIEEFLEEMKELPCITQIRAEYIEHFKQKVDTKTYALIEFIESERKQNNALSIDDIKTYLSIRNDNDLIVILATSEYYKPGLCSWLIGQPSLTGYLPSGGGNL
ncbi:Protein C9orf72 [Trichoplax sp. H2]|uniref:Uncharacterized protein n=1 Tax=Trichoplax adhaerens TaxID=10228 RepID=B3S568_TRIAD|nr:hypothetical protein TRIADDRAFT_59216 [Trichoplax adhaerens]EDV22212.1 hypothetical protein TRIADDRAFT_59216 [Trichoplax adhaerens]RDD46495.1 Protein C9orf72 [Trichoplax sp. H2]|eukprot:XP_002115367.1 hypothetical protein TRIADDRAFT_59216 [Trichoplax adhaerens]